MEGNLNAAGFAVFVIKVFSLALQCVGKKVVVVNGVRNQRLNITMTFTIGAARKKKANIPNENYSWVEFTFSIKSMRKAWWSHSARWHCVPNHSTTPQVDPILHEINMSFHIYNKKRRQNVPQGFKREKTAMLKYCVATSNISYGESVQRRGEWQIRRTKANILASAIAWRIGPQPLIDLSASLNDGGV